MNPYNDGLNEILKHYAEVYKKDGKSFVRIFLGCSSIRTVCKEIVGIYKKEMGDLRKKECVEFAKRYETDQETLADILSLIFYVLN